MSLHLSFLIPLVKSHIYFSFGVVTAPPGPYFSLRFSFFGLLFQNLLHPYPPLSEFCPELGYLMYIS